MLTSDPIDRPLGVQLVGNDDTYILRALEMLDGYDFDLLDFNAACPAPKLTRKGMGAALLREPDRLGEILEILVEWSPVPVTVKIRSGWDEHSVNARDVALRAEAAGVSALFIHGRTKVQGYSGTVDYGVIKDVKESIRIPVIASGDNMTIESVQAMFAATGCDGVAIARGCLGNPWLFSELRSLFEGGLPVKKPSAGEIVEVMRDHLALVTEHYGERKGVSSFRKFFIWYTRGLAGVKPLRDSAFRAETKGDLVSVMEEVMKLDWSRNEYAAHSLSSCPGAFP